MASAEETVNAFVKEWDVEAPELETLLDYFSDDAVYHNIPFRPAKGKEAIAAVLQGIGGSMKSKGWVVLNQAVVGDVVLNERVDSFVRDGAALDVKVCGVFEIREGKIAAWRDFFDAGSMS